MALQEFSGSVTQNPPLHPPYRKSKVRFQNLLETKYSQFLESNLPPPQIHSNRVETLSQYSFRSREYSNYSRFLSFNKYAILNRFEINYAEIDTPLIVVYHLLSVNLFHVALM